MHAGSTDGRFHHALPEELLIRAKAAGRIARARLKLSELALGKDPSGARRLHARARL